MADTTKEAFWASTQGKIALATAGAAGVAGVALAYYFKVLRKDKQTACEDPEEAPKKVVAKKTERTRLAAAPPPPKAQSNGKNEVASGEQQAVSDLQRLGVIESTESLKDRYKFGNVTGKTVLHKLALGEGEEESRRSAEGVKALLSMKAGKELLSVLDSDGNSCLHQAAARQEPYYTEVVTAMLEVAPEQLVLAQNSLGQTVLHVTSNPSVAALLAGRAPGLLVIADKDGDTPLHAAAARGLEPMVQFLLDKEPSLLKVKNKTGSLAVHVAVAQQQTAVALALGGADRLSLEEPSNDGYCPVHLACAAGNLDLVVKLIELRRKTAELLDKEGNSCLHYAAERGYSRLAAFLAALSSPLLTVQNKNGKTCLEVAEENNRDETVRVLNRFMQDGSQRSTPSSSPSRSGAATTPASSRSGGASVTASPGRVESPTKPATAAGTSPGSTPSKSA